MTWRLAAIFLGGGGGGESSRRPGETPWRWSSALTRRHSACPRRRIDSDGPRTVEPWAITFDDDPPQDATLLPIVVAVSTVHRRAVVDDQHVALAPGVLIRSEEHTSELQSLTNLVCRLLL